MLDKFGRFGNDVVGIVTSPGATLGRSMKEKKWVPVFLLLVIAVCLFTYITIPVQMARMAENPQLVEMLSEEQMAFFVNDSMFARVMTCVTAIFFLVLSLIFAAFFVYLFFGIGGSEGVYANYFSLVVNASVIDVLLPGILGTISLLLNINFSIISNPGLFLFPIEPGSWSFLILSRMNVFAIWYLVAIAAGVSVFSKMSFKKSLVISVLYFLFKVLTGAAFAYLVIKIFKTPIM